MCKESRSALDNIYRHGRARHVGSRARCKRGAAAHARASDYVTEFEMHSRARAPSADNEDERRGGGGRRINCDINARGRLVYIHAATLALNSVRQVPQCAGAPLFCTSALLFRPGVQERKS